MKRVFVITFLAAAFAAAACQQPTLEEKKQAFQKEISNITSDFHNSVAKLQEDTTLTQAALYEKYEAIADKAQGKLEKLCIKTVKKNPDNELGMIAFRNICHDLAEEEVIKLIECLSEDNQQNGVVLSLKAAIEARKATAEGKMFTDFEVNGVKFSDYIGKGKYVLVDFWASWCGPCKREIPNIKAVYEKYAGADFDVLSIAVWDKPEDTVASAAEHGVVWNQIIDAQHVPTDIYGIEGIPQIMLFGPDGTILKRDLRGEGIEAAVVEALGR